MNYYDKNNRLDDNPSQNAQFGEKMFKSIGSKNCIINEDISMLVIQYGHWNDAECIKSNISICLFKIFVMWFKFIFLKYYVYFWCR